MLWPIVLPTKIAFWLLAAVVALATLAAPRFKWRRVKAFWIAGGCAALALIPTAIVVSWVVDPLRFGFFEYAKFADITDERAARYLPPAATAIKMHRAVNNCRSWYSISDDDFHNYLDQLWRDYGEYSIVQRGAGDEEGTVATDYRFEREFGALGWRADGAYTIYYGPTERDWGGAIYYFDAAKGEALQQVSYW